MGLPVYWRARTVEEIAELYIREITRGIGTTGVKAGAIKVATGAPVITALEQKFVAAACLAQQATGVPIITHTQDGFGGPEQQALFASGGVAAHRCLIGHCCGNADPAYHQRVVAGGSYIGFDRIGLLRFQPDEVRADNLVRLVRSGHIAQVMISQDRHCGWLGKFARQLSVEELSRIEVLRAEGAWPPPYTYLFTDFVPMLLARGLAEQEIYSMLEDNPRRFFAGEGFGDGR
jgi:phosphotriesterase-related protein